MKYIFKSSEHKDRFADKGSIQQELADKIGMNRFEIEGGWIVVENMNSRIHIPARYQNTVIIDVGAFCFEVAEGKQKLGEIQALESRESKFARLIEIIKGDKAERTATGEIVISNDLTLKLISERDSDSVEAHIDGRQYSDMFSHDETNAIISANRSFLVRKEKEFKENLFMSRKF